MVEGRGRHVDGVGGGPLSVARHVGQTGEVGVLVGQTGRLPRLQQAHLLEAFGHLERFLQQPKFCKLHVRWSLFLSYCFGHSQHCFDTRAVNMVYRKRLRLNDGQKAAIYVSFAIRIVKVECVAVAKQTAVLLSANTRETILLWQTINGGYVSTGRQSMLLSLLCEFWFNLLNEVMLVLYCLSRGRTTEVVLILGWCIINFFS